MYVFNKEDIKNKIIVYKGKKKSRSDLKWAVYFKDMERVNFKLFPRQAF